MAGGGLNHAGRRRRCSALQNGGERRMSYIGPSYPSDTWSRIRQWLRSRRRSRSILNMDIERGMSARPPIISSGFSVLFCR